jgi:hypothetical protein
MDARDKLLVEAGLSETKVILGCFFDFRKLQISLPKNKFITWTTNVSKLIAKRNDNRQGTRVDNQTTRAPCTG